MNKNLEYFSPKFTLNTANFLKLLFQECINHQRWILNFILRLNNQQNLWLKLWSNSFFGVHVIIFIKALLEIICLGKLRAKQGEFNSTAWLWTYFSKPILRTFIFLIRSFRLITVNLFITAIRSFDIQRFS